MHVRITAHVGKVLRVFLDETDLARYGFEIMRRTRSSSGALSAILSRLEAAGRLTSEQEDIDPKVVGRSARRLYRISEEATTPARQELAALSNQLAPRRGNGLLRPRGLWA